MGRSFSHQGTVPAYSLANFAEVLSATRDTVPNATFIIQDTVYDADGQVFKRFDGRSTETRTEYDGRGRVFRVTNAYGTAVAAVTETEYDAVGNVATVRNPRYFDSD